MASRKSTKQDVVEFIKAVEAACISLGKQLRTVPKGIGQTSLYVDKEWLGTVGGKHDLNDKVNGNRISAVFGIDKNSWPDAIYEWAMKRSWGPKRKKQTEASLKSAVSVVEGQKRDKSDLPVPNKVLERSERRYIRRIERALKVKEHIPTGSFKNLSRVITSKPKSAGAQVIDVSYLIDGSTLGKKELWKPAIRLIVAWTQAKKSNSSEADILWPFIKEDKSEQEHLMASRFAGNSDLMENGLGAACIKLINDGRANELRSEWVVPALMAYEDGVKNGYDNCAVVADNFFNKRFYYDDEFQEFAFACGDVNSFKDSRNWLIGRVVDALVEQEEKFVSRIMQPAKNNRSSSLQKYHL